MRIWLIKLLLESNYYQNHNMKKTLTIKTISFKEKNNRQQQSPLHATCRLLSRPETVTPERQSLGSKMTKRLSQKNYSKRLSDNSRQSLCINSKKLYQNSDLQSNNRESKAKNRYKNILNSQKEDISCSVVNYKLSSHHFQQPNSLNQNPKKTEPEAKEVKAGLDQKVQLRKNRFCSQPNNSNDQKKMLISKVSKKLQLFRIMTIQNQVQWRQPNHCIIPSSKQKETSNLFDKMYDYHVKKLNKNLVRYEKNLAKDKDRKYYQLKFESNMLTKELVQIRQNIMNKIEDAENQSNMGVVGNIIDFNKTSESSKMSRKKIIMGCCERRKLKTKQPHNPFAADTRGWEVGEKHEQFYLCQ